MTTTWINDTWPQAKGASRREYLRFWATVIGLALSDGAAFLLAHLLFRAGRSVPILVLFVGQVSRNTSTTIDAFLALALAFVIIRYLSGDYSRRQLFWDGAKITTIAILLTSIPDLVMLVLANGIYSATPVLLSWVFLLAAVPLMRQGSRLFMSRLGVWQIPTAIIGLCPRTSEILDALQHTLSLGFDVRWLVVDNEGTPIPREMSSLAAIQSSDATRTATILCNAGCKEAIVSADDIQSSHFASLTQRLLEVDIPVAIIPSLNRLPLAGITTNYFFGRDVLLLQVRGSVQRLPWRFIKRLFDIVGSAFLLLLLSPLFIFLAIAIKRSSPGSVTYSQTRVGRGGRTFQCIKFRTMVRDADDILRRWRTDRPDLYEEYMKSYKLKDDPRITPIGKWLRRTSFDELPQLLNVLRGDMSLVGPRPVVQQELDQYYGPAAKLYMRTRPGLTGLWQVSGRSDTSYEQRIVLDEWYILNWSFWYDIVILIQTVWSVATGKGAF